jgi:hypothetical protein
VLKRDLTRRPRTILSHIRCRSTCRTLSKSFWIEEKTNLWTCSTNSKETGLLIDSIIALTRLWRESTFFFENTLSWVRLPSIESASCSKLRRSSTRPLTIKWLQHWTITKCSVLSAAISQEAWWSKSLSLSLLLVKQTKYLRNKDTICSLSLMSLRNCNRQSVFHSITTSSWKMWSSSSRNLRRLRH